jgi:hypothetical protein
MPLVEDVFKIVGSTFSQISQHRTTTTLVVANPLTFDVIGDTQLWPIV